MLEIILIFTVFRMKIEQNSYVILKFNAILEVLTIYANYANYFNCTDMQIMYFILDKILKLDLLHAFLSLVVAKLPDLKNTPVLLAHSV